MMNQIKQTLNPFYFLLFLVVCMCFSCADDDASAEEQAMQGQPFQDGDNLSVDEESIRSIFPLEDYKNNTTVVYKNAEGQEYVFLITLKEKSFQCPNQIGCDDLNYTSNAIDIELSRERHRNYQINFKLEPSVYPLNLTFDQCVLVDVLEFSIVIEEDVPDEMISSYLLLNCVDTYEPSGVDVELLDTLYEDIDPIFNLPSNVGFTKVYFTTELGLAAFEDEFNDLFIFDRFE